MGERARGMVAGPPDGLRPNHWVTSTGAEDHEVPGAARAGRWQALPAAEERSRPSLSEASSGSISEPSSPSLCHLPSGRAGLERPSRAWGVEVSARSTHGLARAGAGGLSVGPGARHLWRAIPRPREDRTWGLALPRCRFWYEMLDLRGGRAPWRVSFARPVEALAWSPNGDHLALVRRSAGGCRVAWAWAAQRWPAKLTVLRVADGRITPLGGGDGGELAWSSDGLRLACHRPPGAGGASSAVTLWDARPLFSGERPRQIAAHFDVPPLTSVAFAPSPGEDLLLGGEKARWQALDAAGGLRDLREVPAGPFLRQPAWVDDSSLFWLPLDANAPDGRARARMVWWAEPVGLRSHLPVEQAVRHAAVDVFAVDGARRAAAVVSHPISGFKTLPAAREDATLEVVSLSRGGEDDAPMPFIRLSLALERHIVRPVDAHQERALWAPAGRFGHVLALFCRDPAHVLLVDTRPDVCATERVRELNLDLGGRYVLAFSPCGAFLAVATTAPVAADEPALRLSIATFDSERGEPIFAWDVKPPDAHARQAFGLHVGRHLSTVVVTAGAWAHATRVALTGTGLPFGEDGSRASSRRGLLRHQLDTAMAAPLSPGAGDLTAHRA